MVPLVDEAQVEARFSLSDMVLILTQDRCTVFVKHTIGSESVLDGLETMLKSVQDRCMVCARRTIGS